MTVPLLTRDPIDVAALAATVASAGRGGMVMFVGSVRRGPDDGPVSAIDYGVYDEMAVAEVERMLGEARARWPAACCILQHRVGQVPVGEASIAVVVAAPHRGEAFEACRYVIEEVKRRFPAWKRELFEDGSTRWREEARSERGWPSASR